MRKLLGLVAFVLIAQGAGTLAHLLTGGWFDQWTVVHRIGLLDGYEAYVGVVLTALGVALGAASERLPR
ncbi:hypothetical protein [Streptomyces oceani]|uniref:Uncharacterized protein n=1 Tax=Streptomyces oceani TaxID=1075402 RepID=A0A1E7KIY0_9ACTN|nr:hypothetical protein [Streptomyces oceani]OEV03861.1 hypothetical protein AN216_09385 [Streptomyces oceani]